MIHHLKFDSSQSASVRFFGDVFEIKVHWADGSKVPQVRLVCPDSLRDDDSEPTKHKCKMCESGKIAANRWLSVGWDLEEEAWCVFMGNQQVFSDVYEHTKILSVSPEEHAAGRGADFALQRIGQRTMVVPMKETIGKPRGMGAPPSIEDVAQSLRTKSLWTKYSSVNELIAGMDKGEQVTAKHYVEEPEPQAKPAPPAKPKPSPKASGEKMDPKKLMAEDRWDFLE
jgi:hypothetical protein